MKWEGERESDNVEDRRGLSGRGVAVAGGGAVTIIIAIIVTLMGGDPGKVLQNGPLGGGGGGGGASVASFHPRKKAEQDQLVKFVKVVLADTEDVWQDQFRKMGKTYRNPTLVLFTGQVQTACGGATSASGPFYCPADEKLYIDLAFYQELKSKFKAPGDFAQAYVIAHEVGHHVQKQLGITDRVDSMRRQLSDTEYNKLSVRLELQADFFAGLWANHAQQMKNILDPGDIDEALGAAKAVGDDTIQKAARGYVVAIPSPTAPPPSAPRGSKKASQQAT